MVGDTHSESADALTGPAQRLRIRAEQELRRESEGEYDPPVEDPQHLIHELRVHQVELEMQNEELRRIQGELEQARDGYLDLYDFAPVGYLTINERGLIRQANLTASTMLGIDRALLLKQPLSHFILDKDQDIYYLHRRKLFETQEPQACEVRVVSSDGSRFWARMEARMAIDVEGQFACQATISDIAERKRAEKAMQQLYEQAHQDAATKSLLLQELHHRVKNNLQIVSSLLDLQANRVEGAESVRALRNSAHRVRALALVHENLYQTSEVNCLDLGEYVQGLLRYLASAYEGPALCFDLDVQVDAISLGLGQAIPCGLILTELVSNVFKHAFPPEQTGVVWVSLQSLDSQMTLIVRDEGVGLPALLDPMTSTSLGLSIVRLLTKQLEGQIKVNSVAGTGTAFTIIFPLAPDIRAGTTE